MLAVGRRGCRGVAVLRVALDFGSAARRFAGPEHLAVPPVDRVGEPDIGRAVGAAVDPAVGPVTEDRVGIVADRRGEEDPVTPDDRAGMPEPRDLRAPQDVVSGLGVPDGRRVLPSATPEAAGPRNDGQWNRSPRLLGRGTRSRRGQQHGGPAGKSNRQTAHRWSLDRPPIIRRAAFPPPRPGRGRCGRAPGLPIRRRQVLAYPATVISPP